MLTAAIVSAKIDAGSPLEMCLQQTGLVASVRHWTPDRPPNRAASDCDVVILDFSRSAEACLAVAARIRELRPKALLLGWSPSEQPTAELLLDAMRNGVQDFLASPLDPVKLKEILSRSEKLAEAKNAKLTVVTGVKGGTGATTVAVNLGVQLANLTEKRIALLDFGRPLGHVSLFLDLQPRFGVRDAVENLERLDTHLFDGFLTPHKSGVSVLAGTLHPDDWRRMSTAALARVVGVARQSCDFVVVDLNSAHVPGFSSVLTEADSLIMVAGVDIPNLTSLERHISAVTGLGVDPERLRIVINRWHLRDDELLNRFLEKTQCSVLARLPNDFQQVNQSITLGAPLSKNHGDPLGTQFRELARQLACLAPVPKEIGTREKLFYMLRASKSRLVMPWQKPNEV